MVHPRPVGEALQIGGGRRCGREAQSHRPEAVETPPRCTNLPRGSAILVLDGRGGAARAGQVEA
eukprot:2887972-Alexandrium_andersonii.AAC.1